MVLSLSDIEQVNRLEVYDVQGRLVSSKINFSNHENRLSIYLADLERGVYVLKLYTENGIGISRLLKPD